MRIDLEYPNGLRDSHNEHPLTPEKVEITSNMLSKYCSDITDKYGINVGGVSKLVSNLGDKKIHSSLQKSPVVFVIRSETE